MMFCPEGYVELRDLYKEMIEYARGLETIKGGYSLLSQQYHYAEGKLFLYRFVKDQRKNFFTLSQSGGVLKLSPDIFFTAFPIPDELPKCKDELWDFVRGHLDYVHICPNLLVIRPKHDEEYLNFPNQKFVAEALMPLSGFPIFWKIPTGLSVLSSIEEVIGHFTCGTRREADAKPSEASIGVAVESSTELILRCSREGLSKAEVKRVHFPNDSVRRYAMRRKVAAEVDPSLEKPGRKGGKEKS